MPASKTALTSRSAARSSAARRRSLRTVENHAFFGTPTPRGFIAPFVSDGPIDRNAFETYVEKVLLPELREGDVVIMDNLPSHEGPNVRA